MTDGSDVVFSEANDRISELSFNVDDMTAEELSFALERFYEGGAREVFTVPVGMKKNRQGVLVIVLCDEDIRRKMAELIFRHTSTIGIRETIQKRYVLERQIETVETPFGQVRKKVSAGYGCRKSKYEFEDIAGIARERNISIREAKKMISALSDEK